MIAAQLSLGRRCRAVVIAFQPRINDKVVILLAPEQPAEGLPLNASGVLARCFANSA